MKITSDCTVLVLYLWYWRYEGDNQPIYTIPINKQVSVALKLSLLLCYSFIIFPTVKITYK